MSKAEQHEVEEWYSISELASMFGITPRTVRYYEEVGLLSSRQRESETQQRYYDKRTRGRLKLILRGKRFGFSLSEIKEMIDLYDLDPTEKEQLKKTLAYGDRKIAEIDEMIQELQAVREEMVELREKFLQKLLQLEGEEEQGGSSGQL